ncbi:MAG: hypothetical protein ACWA5R_14420, partial [bacterium]
AGAQPGIVISFSSTVQYGLNFFGNDLGPGDSAYDATKFATRVFGTGVWLDGYDGLELAATPRVYVFPAGADILRSPDPFNFETRDWRVVDQAIPVPFPIGASDLDDPVWNPSFDNLVGQSTQIKRFGQLRAYPFSGGIDDNEMGSDNRLVGRSVANRKWIIIIPGASMLFDPEEGLDTLIEGNLIPGGNGERDGNGLRDIKIYFKSYAYSGS